jgi:Cu-Zn family superoxide dismutase
MRVESVLLPSLLLGAALLFAASPASTEGQKASPVYKASAVLKDASGKDVGTATFSTTPSGALLDLKLDGVPPGVHALHIHAVGKCEPPDFKSAGPHFNPDQTKHGIMSPEGPHAGDLPNIHVPADGKLEVEFLDPVVTLSQESALLDADGSSIVIHAGPDDYKTDPAGNSGDRIACGVITP